MLQTLLEGSHRVGRLRISWVRHIDGLVRTPIYDPEDASRAYVLVYAEKERSYRVEAFDVDDGQRVWQNAVINGGYGAPAVRDSQLLVLSRFCDVTAMSKATGEILWTFQTDTRVRSPISVHGDQAFFSSGGRVIGLDQGGNPTFQASVTDGFLFGAVARVEDRKLFFSLGTRHVKKQSRLYLFGFDERGKLESQCDLGPASVASADTSGVCVRGNTLYVGAVNAVYAVNGLTGEVQWRAEVPGLAHRAICTTDPGRVYATTLEGHLVALARDSGRVLWTRFLSEEGVWMPATVAADRVLVVAGGVLQALAPDTGTLLQQVAVGESPYSACALREGRMLLGGGDPPYHGLLFGFDTCAEGEADFRLYSERESVAIDAGDSIDLPITLEGSIGPISSLTLDLRSLGGDARTPPSKQEGSTYVFQAHPQPGRRWGTYAVPAEVTTDRGTYAATVRVTLSSKEPLPPRVMLGGVPETTQEAAHLSGAACIQAVRRMYGDEVDQKEVRRMVDTILERSGYTSFQLWRLVARRALLTQAKTTEELPEFVP